MKIEDVAKDQKSTSYNHETGVWEDKNVYAIHSHVHEGDLVRVSFAGETVEATDEHPFWVIRGEDLEARPLPDLDNPNDHKIDGGRWVSARDLKVGDVLKSRGGEVKVEGVELVEDVEVEVYNFGVEGLSNYSVGTVGVLVHNDSAGKKSFGDAENMPVAARVAAQDVARRNPPKPTSLNVLNANFVPDLDKLDFGAYLRRMIGDPPAGMFDPHAHHTLFKRGLGPDQQALVVEGHEILWRHGIDPIAGLENLVWAPMRVKGQHDIGALKTVVTRLRQVDSFGGSQSDIIDALTQLGKLAARR